MSCLRRWSSSERPTGQPDRRPRWLGDQRVLGRGRGIHCPRLRLDTREFANYLQLVRIEPAAAELTIFCGALVGASLGFLWWNSYPADIFMG